MGFGNALYLMNDDIHRALPTTEEKAVTEANITTMQTNKKMAEMKMQQMKEAEQLDNTLFPTFSVLGHALPNASTGQKNYLIETAKKMNMLVPDASGNGFLISGKNIRLFKNMMATQKEFGLEGAKIGLQDAHVMKAQLETEMQNPKLKPEELTAIKEKYTGVVQQITTLNNVLYADKYATEEAQARGKSIEEGAKYTEFRKPDGTIVKAPNAVGMASGWTPVDIKTESKDTTIGKVDPKDFTPESVSKYSQTGNYGDLVKVETDKGKIPIQSDKIQVAMAELGIDPADPKSYTPENISKAGARMRVRDAQERSDKNEQLTAVQRASIEHNLRTELRQDKYVQDFKDVDNKYQVMERAINKAGTKPESYVAVDQALITLYNKMTDPTSVVRESEYARTPENMAITNRVLGKLDKWKQGGAGLTDVERNALIDMAREFHRGYSVNYDQIVSDFEQTAKSAGVDPMAIGVPYRRKSQTIVNQPKEQYEVGKVYKDAQGKKAKYLGGGQWQPQ